MADKYSSGRPMAKMKAGGERRRDHTTMGLPYVVRGKPTEMHEAGMGGRAAAALRLLDKGVRAAAKYLTRSKKPSRPKFDKSKAAKDATQAMKKGKIEKPTPKAKPRVSKPSKKAIDKYMRQRDRNVAAKAKPSKIPKKGPTVQKTPVPKITKAPPKFPKAKSRKTLDPAIGGATLASSQGRPKKEEKILEVKKPIKRSPMPKFKKAEKVKPIKKRKLRYHRHLDLTLDENKGKFPGLKFRTAEEGKKRRAAAKAKRDRMKPGANKAKKDYLDMKRQEKRYPSKEK